MIIKSIAIGNQKEGYIENRLSDEFNIIYSDDNNKGKTIVIQGMLYALGNEPAFPASFNYQDYYYFVKFEENDREYWICKSNSEFILNDSGKLFIFDNVSELKRYWNKNICELPCIEKNGINRIADPELLMQLHFVGQDKKDTSNIANRGFYNKVDFTNLIYSFAGIGAVAIKQEDIDIIKEKLSSLEDERKTLINKHRILKSKKKAAAYLSSINDMSDFQKKLKNIESVQNKITELRKTRNNLATRKSQWESTIKELNSLNRTIKKGELRCMDCDSTNIMYKGSKKDSFSFDVSNVEMRSQIISSIEDKIDSFAEEMEKTSAEIKVQNKLLQELLNEDDITLETIVSYKAQILGATDAEQKITEIDLEIGTLKSKIEASEKGVHDERGRQEELLNQIYDQMEDFYKTIDPNGNLSMRQIFTKKDKVYSGSDATMFYLAKMFAFAKVLGHNYPIIVDSFRAEDLSTEKEGKVIDRFREISNQIIFTTTLKKEEEGKYGQYENINELDYSTNNDSQIIDKKYGPNIEKIMNEFYFQ